MNKKRQELGFCMVAVLIFVIIIMMNLLASPTPVKSQAEPAQENLELPAGGTWYVTPSPVPEIEQNLAKQTEPETFRTIPDCPWSEPTQRKINDICKKYYISFSLIMSMAYEESRFDETVTGDEGQAVGAWQIHPSTWGHVIKKLGYTASDMKKPVPAAEVTCYIMTAHFKKLDEVYYFFHGVERRRGIRDEKNRKRRGKQVCEKD